MSELFLEHDWKHSDQIIRSEVAQILRPENIQPNKDRLEEYFESIINSLSTKTTFEAYLYFPQVTDMPIGLTVGELEIIEKPDKEPLTKHMQSIFDDNNTGQLTEKGSWGKFEFESYKRVVRVDEDLVSEIQPVLGALKLALKKTLTPENISGAIFTNEEVICISPETKRDKVSSYDAHDVGTLLNDLSKLLQKSEKGQTPLEQNIIGALRLLTLHDNNYRNEHSFLTLVGILEGMLVGRNERPKGDRMAEKTVHLLYDGFSIEDKVGFYYHVKNWYNIRSMIIHGEYQRVRGRQIREVEATVELVIRKLLKLTDSYYSLQKQGGENNPYEGLNNMFLKKRLAVSS